VFADGHVDAFRFEAPTLYILKERGNPSLLTLSGRDTHVPVEA
jgi:hypothetical protein